MGWLTSGESWSAISAAILSTVGALLGMIPQGLVLLTSSVLAIATIRLARRKVLAQQLYCIETLARVDVLCLDKTGTITSGRMEVEGTYLAESDGSVVACSREDGAKLPAGASPDAERIAALDCALSGIARATSADANETCTAILARYADETAVPRAVRTVAFSSAKKWSGATSVSYTHLDVYKRQQCDPASDAQRRGQAPREVASASDVLEPAVFDLGGPIGMARAGLAA